MKKFLDFKLPDLQTHRDLVFILDTASGRGEVLEWLQNPDGMTLDQSSPTTYHAQDSVKLAICNAQG